MTFLLRVCDPAAEEALAVGRTHYTHYIPSYSGVRFLHNFSQTCSYELNKQLRKNIFLFLRLL